MLRLGRHAHHRKEHVTGGEAREGEPGAPAVNPGADIHLFGQEVNPETFTICKSDPFMKSDGGRDAGNVVFGSHPRTTGTTVPVRAKRGEVRFERKQDLLQDVGLTVHRSPADFRGVRPDSSSILSSTNARRWCLSASESCRSEDGSMIVAMLPEMSG